MSLVLDNNTIGDDGLTALCEACILNLPSLRHISIKCCGITGASMQALLHCYEEGCALYQVELQGNAVGCEAVDAFIVGDKSQVRG